MSGRPAAILQLVIAGYSGADALYARGPVLIGVLGLSHLPDFCARALKRTLGRHGPGAVGLLGSARATNEEAYLAQKFARLVLGTNNIDCCARVCH